MKKLKKNNRIKKTVCKSIEEKYNEREKEKHLPNPQSIKLSDNLAKFEWGASLNSSEKLFLTNKIQVTTTWNKEEMKTGKRELDNGRKQFLSVSSFVHNGWLFRLSAGVMGLTKMRKCHDGNENRNNKKTNSCRPFWHSYYPLYFLASSLISSVSLNVEGFLFRLNNTCITRWRR